MTTTIRATADSLLREALATTRRIAALADADQTNNAVDEQRRADAIYDLADAADRVLATYRSARACTAGCRPSLVGEPRPDDRVG